MVGFLTFIILFILFMLIFGFQHKPCPHCKEPILIEKLNCCIFRHGVLKNNEKQIEPHASKDLCDYYVKNDLIYGCGKEFKIQVTKKS